MISLSRLRSLTPKVAIKKASLIVSSKIHDGKSTTDDYCLSLYSILANLEEVDGALLFSLVERVKNGENPLLIAEYLKALSGLGDASFDYLKGHDSTKKRDVRDFYLVLDHIRSPYNVGAIFRSAESFGVKKIYLLSDTDTLSHPRAVRTSAGTIDMVESEYVSDEAIKNIIKSDKEAVVFSLECGGESLSSFEFPQKGYCFIGGEEFGVSKQFLDISSHIVTINTGGLKGSLNVSVSTGILLNSWYNSHSK